MLAKKEKVSKITPAMAKKILREVPHREAFYFFTGIGQYTGNYAISLVDFYYKMDTLDLKTVLFHFYRKDFEKWIKETIGDEILAEEISALAEYSTGKELRLQIRKKIGHRLTQLENLLVQS